MIEILSATIVCSLIDFSAIENGKWVNYSAEDLSLEKTPHIPDIPDEAKLEDIDDGKVLWRTGDSFNSAVSRIYDEKAMTLTTIYSFYSNADTIVTVQAIRGCIEIE